MQREQRQRQRSRQNFKYKYNDSKYSNNNYINKDKEQQKIIRQVYNLDIGNTKVVLIWKHPKYQKQSIQKQLKQLKNTQNTQNNNKSSINFNINLIKSSKPPSKTLQPQNSHLSQLKNAITPVQQIWSTMIKQYLNDSQFVEIARKNNSLQYGQVKYGKTIINYNEGNKVINQRTDKNSINYQQKYNNHKKTYNKQSYYTNSQSQYPIFSRAYFKLWQILSLGILNKKRQQQITIACLAQGPGGFLHSLIDYRLRENKTLQDKYYSITLKIEENKTRNAKDWSDHRSIQFFKKMKDQGYKVNLSYGQCNDGDLLKIQNIDSFKTHVMQGNSAFLVTGDGGIQCISDQQYHYQQIFNSKLFFAEILTALKIQQIGGTFILKIYDIHFQITKQLIMLICVYYRKVGVIKPLTSRPGNSEKYLLCEGFFGVTKVQLYKLQQLLNKWTSIQSKLSYFQNNEFVHQVLQFNTLPSQPYNSFHKTIAQRITILNKYLSQQQQRKIQQGLKLIQKYKGNKQMIKKQLQQQRFKYQLSYAYQWCRKYKIETIKVNFKGKKDGEEM